MKNLLIFISLLFVSNAMADNLKVNPVTASPGTTVQIPVELVNAKVYSMFEMNVVLPNGFELTGVTKSERFKNGRLYDFSKQSDGSYQIVTQSQEEVITGNSGTLLTLSVKVPTTAQGSYTGRIQNVLFTDMNITPAYFPDVSFTITVSKPSTITITAKSYSREYGDANPTFEYTVTGGTITGTPKLTCTATKTSDVDSYTITVEKGTVQGDVKLVNGTLTVTKAPLTVKANDCERSVGEDNPSFTLSYSGWKNGQGESVLTSKPTATCSATKNSPAGTYPIKVSGGSAKNYSFKYVEGTLTVKEESSSAPDIKLISWACDNNDLSNLTQDDQLVFHVTWKNNGKTAYLDTQLGLQKIGEDVLLFIRSSQDYREYPKDKEITVTYELSLSGVAEGQYKVHALWYQNWGEIKDWGWYHYIYRSYGEITVNAPSASRTITTSAAGYATFYDSQSNYTLPSGLTAKVVTSVSNGKLTYQTLAGSMVPKGTAVILESSTKQAATYTLTPTTDSGSYTGTNLLRGSDEATTTMGDGYHYKLTYGPSTDSSLKDVFGWYWGSSNGGSFQIDGHKAWLVLPKSAGTRSFSVDGVANVISDMNNDATEGEHCYDLQGRRVQQPARKGIFVSNGKKIVNK